MVGLKLKRVLLFSLGLIMAVTLLPASPAAAIPEPLRVARTSFVPNPRFLPLALPTAKRRAPSTSFRLTFVPQITLRLKQR